MDLHIYTRELLEKHLLPELKEIAQGLGIIPDGNKTRRETWVAALVGKSFPIFQTIENSLDGDRIEEPTENSPGVDRAQERIENSPGVDRAQERIEDYLDIKELWKLDCADCPACGGIDSLNSRWSNEYAHGFWIINCQKCHSTCTCSIEDLPPCLREESDKDEDDDNEAELIGEFPDMKSALAEIARLRTQNDELLQLVRRAKDISPVEKPSLKRVLALARAACMDISKSLSEGWVLSMGHLKRSFKKLRDIWDLLITDDWHLMDLFSPPPLPVVKRSIFSAASYTRYSAIPFADDNLIDTWSLGVNAVSSGRAPPGGDAM